MLGGSILRFLVIVLFGVGLAPFAEAQQHVVRRQAPAEPAEITADADTIIVPMDFSAGRPTVRVWLNGKGPYPFVFDTGAHTTVLDAKLAKELGLEELKSDEQIMVGDPSQKNTVPATRGRTDSLRVGGATLHSLSFTAIPLGARFESKFVGVLGVGHFSEYVIEMDYPANRIRLYKGELPAGRPGVVEYYAEMGLIAFAVEVGGQHVDFHLDSGSSGGFSVTPDLAQKLKWGAEPESIRVAKSVSNEFPVYEGTLDGSVTFAGFTYENPKVAYMEILRSGNLGQQILRELVVSIDQKHKRLAFAKR